jgi:thioredoxin-dependent peroxiredoxin
VLECLPLRESGTELRAFDVAYFEASVDSVERNREVAEALDLAHPILSDPGRRVADAYGVLAGGRRTAARWTFYIGTDGRILYIDRNVVADGHGEEVPARLTALGIPRRQ